MNIVSRWGVLVYQSESIDEPWDGRVDGQLAPSGVYVVNVEYLDGMGSWRNQCTRLTVLSGKQ